MSGIESLSDAKLFELYAKDVGPEKSAIEYYKSKGWTGEQASAIVGNLHHESGGLDPLAVGDGGDSFGLAQWNSDRRKGLFSYARSKGEKVPSFLSQLEYVQSELTGPESTAGEALRSSKTVSQATRVFSDQYERPGNPMMGSRLSRAFKMFKDFATPSDAYAAEIPKRAEAAGSGVDLSSLDDKTLLDMAINAGIIPKSESQAQPVKPQSAPSYKPSVSEMTNDELLKASRPDLPAPTRIDPALYLTPNEVATKAQPPEKRSTIRPLDSEPGVGPAISRTLFDIVNWFETPPDQASNAADRIYRQVPEGVDKGLYQVAKGALSIPVVVGETAKQVMSGKASLEDMYLPYLHMVKGIYDAVGTPLGVNGYEAAKKRWDEDPGGAIVAVGSVLFPFAGSKAPTKGTTNIPKTEMIGENLLPKASPLEPISQTPVTKSAYESAKVFIEELEKPKSAAESAQAIEAAIGRGELPMEQPAPAPLMKQGSPEGLTTSPFPITEGSAGELNRVSSVPAGAMKPPGRPPTPEQLIAMGENVTENAPTPLIKPGSPEGFKTSDFPNTQGEAGTLKTNKLPFPPQIRKVHDAINAKRAERGLPPLDIKRQGGFINIGDMAEAVQGLWDEAKNLGIEIPIQATEWFMKTTKNGNTPEAKLNAAIDRGISKSIRPSVEGQRSYSQMHGYAEKARDAVKYIVKNKDSLNLTNEFGEAVKQLPKSLSQFSQAIDQAKTSVFSKYNDMAVSAGERGAKVKLDPVISELKSVVDNKVLKDMAPGSHSYAMDRLSTLEGRGEYSVLEAQEAIKILNKTLDAFYKNPSYETASRAGVDALIVNNLRKALDSSIESIQGPGYQSLKDTYGALKTIERDVNRRAVVDARKNIKGLVDFSTIFSGSELINGLVTMNPASIVTGFSVKAIANRIKWWNEPNRIVSDLFSEADKLMNNKPKKRAELARQTIKDGGLDSALGSVAYGAGNEQN